MARTRQSPDAIAAKIVRCALPDEPPSLDDIIGWGECGKHREGELWERLCKVVIAERPDRDRLSREERVEIEERLQAALPESLHMDLVRYSDSMNADADAEREAAYLVGVQVGLRLRKAGA
jgi:hypothetical protein